MARRSGLGKGLGALIPDAEPSAVGPDAAPSAAGEGGLRELPIDQVRPNRYQPRGHFGDEPLASLTASIKALGVLQPVLVRPAGDHFELIAGERRWRAARDAGLRAIPALVREIDDNASLEQALVENLHREDLSALEEAAAFQQLADEFDLSFEDIGQRVGKSRSTVANAVRLLQLPTAIQRLVNERALTAGHARALLPVDDPDVQQQLAERVVAEDLSVRQTEEAVRLLGTEAPGAGRAKAAGPSGERPPGLIDLEARLSEALATRVQIAVGGRQRGKIVVSFAGYEDLERLCDAISPPDPHGV